MSKVSCTIHVSDTIDQFNRRIHVNVRNSNVTMVYRWKDRKSTKLHTQRTTLSDAQAARLLAILTKQLDKAIGTDQKRSDAFLGELVKAMKD